MAESVIGALQVLLNVNTAAFSDGLKNAEKSLSGFGDGLASVGKKIAGALSVGAVVLEINKMIHLADEMGKASQKFGVPVEQLSALKYAADLADVSFESLGKGLGKLSKAMLESAANPAGEAAKNFKALGVAVTDSGGNIKSTETVFTDIAQKFSTMEDGAAKTALAIRIFGRAGADLIPLLNAGKTGIQGLTDEAKRLGIVISAETAMKAEMFNDTMKRAWTSVQAIALKIAEALLPALQSTAEWLAKVATEGIKFDFGNLITQEDIQTVQRIALAFENLARIFAAFKALGTATTFEGLKAALAGLDAAVDTNRQKVEELKRSWMSLGTAGAFESMENLPAQMARVAQGMTTANIATLGAKNALDQFIESQKKSLARHEAEAATLNMVVGVRERQKLLIEADSIARENNITITAAQAAKLTELGIAAENTAIKLAGAQMSQEALTAWDIYAQKIELANKVMAKHPELAEAARKYSIKAAATMAEAYGTSAANAMGDFAEFFKTFGKGNKEMFIISKAFSISQAIINTFVGATKALATLPPPLSYIAAAAVTAAGLAMVAKIIAEKPPAGMALGGAFQVSGAGGVDSQMVPIMATPGERVSIDQNKYGESGGGSRTVTVQGIKSKDYYTGDVLRDIIDNINTAIGDGYKLKVA